VICDIGHGDRVIALRADLDALPLPDTKDVPYRSTVDNVAHACGHDVHTTIMLGVGLAGPFTAAADTVEVKLTGRGGHTARPHLTTDLVHALGRVIVDVPSLLDRRVDPRAGISMVWGTVHAGEAYNAIPGEGTVKGTVRVLNREAWREAPVWRPR
jgi:metal-dependent amidase/aminoacylase/carboxypeptidase family protein